MTSLSNYDGTHPIYIHKIRALPPERTRPGWRRRRKSDDRWPLFYLTYLPTYSCERTYNDATYLPTHQPTPTLTLTLTPIQATHLPPIPPLPAPPTQARRAGSVSSAVAVAAQTGVRAHAETGISIND